MIMSHCPHITSRFARLVSLVAAVIVMGTLFAGVAVGLTGSNEQFAAIAPALA
jgi:hypothetical protein